MSLEASWRVDSEVCLPRFVSIVSGAVTPARGEHTTAFDNATIIRLFLRGVGFAGNGKASMIREPVSRVRGLPRRGCLTGQIARKRLLCRSSVQRVTREG